MSYKASNSKNPIVDNSYNVERIIVGYFIIVLASVGLIKIGQIMINELMWLIK
jgi:hypothetical protein